MKHKTFVASLILSIIFALLNITVFAANVGLGNMPGNDVSQTAIPGSVDKHGIVFTVPAGDNYTVTSFTARLKMFTTACNTQIQVFTDGGAVPGLLVGTFSSFNISNATPQNYTFTPTSTITLVAQQSYWVVISCTGGGSMAWQRNDPPIVPTGLFTFDILKQENGGIWSDFSTTNVYSFQLNVEIASSADGNIVYPPDNRINWQFGDLGAVLYRGTDSDGNPAINVYCYDGENSSLGMQVSETNMSNDMSANGCNVTFHVLADGGYQFNIEYDGKRYEIECADFECNPPEMRYFDPNE